MDELREFYLETIQSSRRTLNSILNILHRQEETFSRLVESSRQELLRDDQPPLHQNVTQSSSTSSSRTSGTRRGRSLFEVNRNTPIMASTQVQRRRIFNPSTRSGPAAQSIPSPAAAGPAPPSIFSRAGSASSPATQREANIGTLLAAALMAEMGARLSPVVVRPTPRQIAASTIIVPYSDIPESDRIDECPISREAFSETSAVMRISHCGHYFAPESLRTWFNTSVRCPICRHDIRSTLPSNLANDHNVEEEEEEQEEEDNDNEIEYNQDDNVNNETSSQSSTDPTYISIISNIAGDPITSLSPPAINSTFMNDDDGTTSFITANPLGDLMDVIRNDTQNTNNTSVTYTIDFSPYFNDPSNNIN